MLLNKTTSVPITVGVAVYNVEKYLSICIDSLVNQTFSNIEIILVDDGSTDSSGRICDEYASKDSRIRVIHKKNGGLGTARQAALENANGDYLYVCDADDWVETTILEKLYNRAKETGADIEMCDYISEYGDGKKTFSCYGKKVSKNQSTIIYDTLNDHFPSSVWSRLFKRSIFQDNNISWEAGINMGEDFLIFLKVLQVPVVIDYLPEPLYHYRRMPGESSLTNKVTLSSYNQMLYIQRWIESNYNNSSFTKGINHYLINIAFAGLRVEEGMSAAYYRKTSTKKISVKSLINDCTLKSIIILWTKLLGYRAGRGVYKLMYKLVYR